MYAAIGRAPYRPAILQLLLTAVRVPVGCSGRPAPRRYSCRCSWGRDVGRRGAFCGSLAKWILRSIGNSEARGASPLRLRSEPVTFFVRLFVEQGYKGA